MIDKIITQRAFARLEHKGNELFFKDIKKKFSWNAIYAPDKVL